MDSGHFSLKQEEGGNHWNHELDSSGAMKAKNMKCGLIERSPDARRTKGPVSELPSRRQRDLVNQQLPALTDLRPLQMLAAGNTPEANGCKCPRIAENVSIYGRTFRSFRICWVLNALSSPPQMLVRNPNPKLRTRRPIHIKCISSQRGRSNSVAAWPPCTFTQSLWASR